MKSIFHPDRLSYVMHFALCEAAAFPTLPSLVTYWPSFSSGVRALGAPPSVDRGCPETCATSFPL